MRWNRMKTRFLFHKQFSSWLLMLSLFVKFANEILHHILQQLFSNVQGDSLLFLGQSQVRVVHSRLHIRYFGDFGLVDCAGVGLIAKRFPHTDISGIGTLTSRRTWRFLEAHSRGHVLSLNDILSLRSEGDSLVIDFSILVLMECVLSLIVVHIIKYSSRFWYNRIVKQISFWLLNKFVRFDLIKFDSFIFKHHTLLILWTHISSILKNSSSLRI